MTRAQLKELHGTPAEFAAACNRAADNLIVTTAECEAAIEKYQREWNAADSSRPTMLHRLKSALYMACCAVIGPGIFFGKTLNEMPPDVLRGILIGWGILLIGSVVFAFACDFFHGPDDYLPGERRIATPWG